MKDSRAILNRFSNQHDVYIIAEVEMGKYFVFNPNGLPPTGPFIQLFTTHRDATPEKVKELLQLFVNGERIINIFGLRIGILLCGENNILTNKQSRGNEPSLRHFDQEWPIVYDVLLNPAHTTMGNWNKLHKRFSLFSSSGAFSVYCTNNNAISSWKSSFSVYRNGQEVYNGNDSTVLSIDARFLKIHL